MRSTIRTEIPKRPAKPKREKNKKEKTKRKKKEFAKFILGIYAFACIAWVQQNYALAFLDKQDINETVTVTIITSLGVTILGYYAKSLGEKHSRNVNKIDADGNFFTGFISEPEQEE